jgi:hypothetical protein
MEGGGSKRVWGPWQSHSAFKTSHNSFISQLEKVPKLASNGANELYEQIAYKHLII